MPDAHRRPPWVWIAALVLGATLVILGLGSALALGPSGRVEATTRVPGPGIAIIGKDALRASFVPVHVELKSTTGSATVIRMLDDDAHAALDASRHVVIDGASFVPRALRSTETGDGPMPRALNADTFLDTPMTGDPLRVDVTASRLPQALLVFPGKPGEARDDAVDVTMAWTNSAWFWESVGAMVLGALLVGAGAVGLRRNGARAGTPDGARARGAVPPAEQEATA